MKNDEHAAADRNRMTASWTLRRYRDGDEHAIVDLLNAAFGDWGSVEDWRWKYGRNPAGSPIIWLAQCGNRIIGHYGIIPVTMKVGNAYVTASFTQDAATHPDYQGQGVFSSIVNKSYLDASEKGIPITYGFADTTLEQTYKRYEHMGHICFMIPMTKVLNWEPFLATYVRSKFLTHTMARALRKARRSRRPRVPLRIETTSRFDQRIDRFWEQISPSFKIIVRRDERYLNWRYVDKPKGKYAIYTAVKDHRILGYCVLGEKRWPKFGRWQNLKLGLILDILGVQDDPQVVGCLIDRAVKCFEQQDVDAITCMVSEKHPYGPLLRKAGFITPPLSLTHTSLHVSINLPGHPIDEKQVYSQALLLSQNCFLKEKGNWFMLHDLIDMP
ncbi:GNAT family N-acetyltransferase [Candidatus Bathyarchaeota archaeon]|nr:GNAT family N-acetyltransferase [Candidatus Bathyarchaeota archaeon]